MASPRRCDVSEINLAVGGGGGGGGGGGAQRDQSGRGLSLMIRRY